MDVFDSPAFPTKELYERKDGIVQAHWHQGLTKREWFAGMALTGILANPELYRAAVLSSENHNVDPAEVTVRLAVKHARAMLLELAEETDEQEE